MCLYRMFLNTANAITCGTVDDAFIISTLLRAGASYLIMVSKISLIEIKSLGASGREELVREYSSLLALFKSSRGYSLISKKSKTVSP